MLISQICFAESLKFNENGFKIDSLESQEKNVFFQALSMSLPPQKGLQAGVIVQIQPSIAKNLKEYKAFSEKEFSSYNIELIKSEIINKSYMFEYIHTVNTRVRLHGYSKALMKGNLIYLATGTAPVDDWKELGNKIVSVVNSFELM